MGGDRLADAEWKRVSRADDAGRVGWPLSVKGKMAVVIFAVICLLFVLIGALSHTRRRREIAAEGARAMVRTARLDAEDADKQRAEEEAERARREEPTD